MHREGLVEAKAPSTLKAVELERLSTDPQQGHQLERGFL